MAKTVRISELLYAATAACALDDTFPHPLQVGVLCDLANCFAQAEEDGLLARTHIKARKQIEWLFDPASREDE